MHLLGHRRIGPGGRLIIGNAHSRQPALARFHGAELVAGEGNLATHELRPERGESGRVRTVQGGRRQASQGHLHTVPATHPVIASRPQEVSRSCRWSVVVQETLPGICGTRVPGWVTRGVPGQLSWSADLVRRWLAILGMSASACQVKTRAMARATEGSSQYQPRAARMMPPAAATPAAAVASAMVSSRTAATDGSRSWGGGFPWSLRGRSAPFVMTSAARALTM